VVPENKGLASGSSLLGEEPLVLPGKPFKVLDGVPQANDEGTFSGNSISSSMGAVLFDLLFFFRFFFFLLSVSSFKLCCDASRGASFPL
jgi:hypothetical protein